MYNVFIDGREGTTGLEIYDRLGKRKDIELLTIAEDKRKDPDERKKLINASDIVFLCLPDAAAVQAVELGDNGKVRFIDASTAHRTASGWAYGFPELSKEHRSAIEKGRYIANPGCHASGFISSVYPLRKMGILPADYPLTCYSLTGYSGGGKKLISEYEDPNRDVRHESHRIYGTNLAHKHLPEMKAVCALDYEPLFSPILGDFYRGMATTIMLENRLLCGKPDAQEIHSRLAEYYKEEYFVQVAPFGGDEPVIYASTLGETNFLRLIVCGNERHTTVTALFDNLGKGASGAAVQNMNIMLGLDEKTGLIQE